MKKKICFNVDKLSKLLPNYTLRNFKVNVCDEEYDYEENQYYFCLPNVDSIEIIHSIFGRTMYIILNDGTKITAKSENINTHDLSIIRINNNNFVSPKLICDGTFVESTKELLNWLLCYNITENELEDITKIFTIYEDIEYPGVPTPNYSFGTWGYSSNALVLKEQEIETVLNSIEDVLLREKIKCILYARVFKKN